MVTGDAKPKVVFLGPEDDPLTYERAELEGMDVEIVYEIASRKDAEGNEYLAYFLKPAA